VLPRLLPRSPRLARLLPSPPAWPGARFRLSQDRTPALPGSSAAAGGRSVGEMPESAESAAIPSLFPDRLVDLCLDTVLGMVQRAGARVEARAAGELGELRSALGFWGLDGYQDVESIRRGCTLHCTALHIGLGQILPGPPEGM
jgi:hypothetical protein